jgi:hypothetical protein
MALGGPEISNIRRGPLGVPPLPEICWPPILKAFSNRPVCRAPRTGEAGEPPPRELSEALTTWFGPPAEA